MTQNTANQDQDNDQDDSGVIHIDWGDKGNQADSTEIEWPPIVKPDQRVEKAVALFFPALEALRASIPPDVYNQIIHEAVEQIVTAFTELQKATAEYKDWSEIFEMVYTIETAQHEELKERYAALFAQNNRMAKIIQSTADYLHNALNNF